MTYFRRRGARRPNHTSINVAANLWVAVADEAVVVVEEVLMKEDLRGSQCLLAKATFSELIELRDLRKRKVRMTNEDIISKILKPPHLIRS